MRIWKIYFICYCLFLHFLTYAERQVIEKQNKCFVGLDLSQFNFLVSEKPSFMNFSGSVHYKPLNFLTLNGVLGYNKVNDERSQGYSELHNYKSKGGYGKCGFDLSIGLSKRKSNKRLFLGYQWGILRFSESGLLNIKGEYWGDFQVPFERRVANYSAGEWVWGFQWEKENNWGFRVQFYSMDLKPDRKISHSKEIADGYRTPFIPGYGYRRGGLNFILLYRIK